MGPLVAAIPLVMGALGTAGAAAGTAAGLAGAAGTLGWAGTALSAGSAIFGGIQAKQANDYQAAVANNNATIMESNRQQALIAGQNAESRQRLNTSKLGAEQIAQMAANGIDVSQGSALAVQQGTQNEGELDAQTIRFNAARQAYGYGTEAQNFRDEAKMQKAAGKNALLGGILKGGASFLGGASSIARNYGRTADVGVAG